KVLTHAQTHGRLYGRLWPMSIPFVRCSQNNLNDRQVYGMKPHSVRANKDRILLRRKLSDLELGLKQGGLRWLFWPCPDPCLVCVAVRIICFLLSAAFMSFHDPLSLLDC